MANPIYDFGVLGLGVMGRNLLLNIAEKGIPVTGLDLDPSKIEALQNEKGPQMVAGGTTDIRSFVQTIKKPRAILMLVPSGKPVDDAINSLMPFLEKGDILIDGGNSFFLDTERRNRDLTARDIHFFGMGISGGEEGARYGPSLMPGGDRKAYERLKPVFESVAAKAAGEPCVDFMGNGAAGHFVKMVHNGIEYGQMQLISETYDLFKTGLRLEDSQIQLFFESWNRTELQSYLLEITALILKKKDEDGKTLLLNLISDQARQKGTGKWTSQNAMDLQVPVPTIDMAVVMRDISAQKDLRVNISGLFENMHLVKETGDNIPPQTEMIRKALYFSMLVTYIQGFAQLAAASIHYNFETSLSDVARIWRGGCIIRAASLDIFRSAFGHQPGLSNLLLNPQISEILVSLHESVRLVVKWAVGEGIPLMAHSASLGYFEAMRRRRLPTNLVQAQRDFFGAHRYERTDREGSFHTEWNNP